MFKGRLTLLSLFSALALTTQGQSVVSVADFGAAPDDGINDAPALRAAAAYCRAHAGTTLVFPAGTYELEDTMAMDIERRAISGAYGRGIEVQWKLFRPQRPFVTGLDFTGCHRLTIEAHGAVLRVAGWMQVLSFIGCQDIVLKGLSITYRRPAATEARVVAVDEDHYDLEFDPQLYAHIDSIVQGRYYFYSRQRHHFYYFPMGRTELLQPGRFRVHSSQQPPLDDVCIIRYGGHYRPCIMIKESARVRVEGVTLSSFPGMGIVGHLSEDIMIDHLNVEPEPGRYSSTSTDATHFTSCSGTLTIQNSHFCGNGDDCTNIHNYYYQALPQADASAIELRIEGADLHAQSLDYPFAGDTLVLIDEQNMRERGRYVVRSTEVSAEDWRVIAHLDRPIQEHEVAGALMYNQTRFPKVRILNNRVDYHNGRAFLLKARDVEVRGNHISGCTLSAIKLGAELSWREAGPVERVVIEDNEICHTGTEPSYVASCVMVSTEAPETPSCLNTNILIRNNRLQSDRPVSIRLADAAHVRIEGNTFIGHAQVIRQNCEDVEISK